MSRSLIAIDFDGTIVDHQYPETGKPVPHAIESIKELQRMGWSVMLWTMRSGETLTEAVNYCERNGIELFCANQNPKQFEWTSSPKLYAQHYIDDAAVGCPLIKNVYRIDGRPMVDWIKILQYFKALKNREREFDARKNQELL